MNKKKLFGQMPYSLARFLVLFVLSRIPVVFLYEKVPIYANSPHIDIYKRDKWGLRPKASLFLYISLFFAKSPGVETIRSKYIFEFSKLELYQKMIKKIDNPKQSRVHIGTGSNSFNKF